MPKVTPHKLSWQESLIGCCEWSSGGKCGTESHILLPSLHCLSDPLCDCPILLPSPLQKPWRKRWVQTDFWCRRHRSPCKGRNSGCRWLQLPQVSEETLQIAARPSCGGFSPILGSRARKPVSGGKAKWEKNSYSPGALAGAIRMWGYMGWPWSKKPETPFHPFVLHFPLCGSCSPLPSPSPSSPGNSGRGGRGE